MVALSQSLQIQSNRMCDANGVLENKWSHHTFHVDVFDDYKLFY